MTRKIRSKDSISLKQIARVYEQQTGLTFESSFYRGIRQLAEERNLSLQEVANAIRNAQADFMHFKGGERVSANEHAAMLKRIGNDKSDRRRTDDEEDDLHATLLHEIRTAVDVSDYVKVSIVWRGWVMERLQRLARSDDGDLSGHYKNGREDKSVSANEGARALWPWASEGRVFAFPPETWTSLHHWADVHTTEDLMGLSWRSTEDEIPDEDEQRFYAKRIKELAAQVPFPTNLPFPSVTFLYGVGIELSKEAMRMRLGGEVPALMRQIVAGQLIGHIVTETGCAWEICVGAHKDGGGVLVFFAVCEHGKWKNAFALNPWTITATVDLINSFKTFVHEAKKRTYRKATEEDEDRSRLPSPFARARPTPKPFYTLPLAQETVEEHLRMRRSGQRAQWVLKHRHDVRGHERVRIRRGKLPIDAREESDLLSRGYKLYTDKGPTQKEPAWRLLSERHERPKAADEWLAVKVSWVHSFVRGPKDGPYIPAVRTLPEGREAP